MERLKEIKLNGFRSGLRERVPVPASPTEELRAPNGLWSQ